MAVWKDIDIMLNKKQDGDIADMTEIEAIKNSLRNICTTLQGERRMLPEFAMPIYELLFEPIDEITSYALANEILQAIHVWDDRIVVENINVEADYDHNQYNVTLTFRIKTSNNTDSVNFVLKTL